MRGACATKNYNKLCKMKFVTSDTVNKYTGVQAKIINSNEGVIDTQTFNFSDIIGMQKIRDDDIEPHIWVYNQKPDWYLPVNASQKAEIADTILDYIEMFQDQQYGLSMQFK